MSEVFIGQIMLTAFNFAPRGFALCNGQLLPISQYQALFSLLGTQYGGDGRVTFALPDLRGRTPTGAVPSADPAWQPPAYQMGEIAGSESVTLLEANLPAHTHAAVGTTVAGSLRNPAGTLLGGNTANLYAPATGTQVPLAAQTVAPAGGNQPHQNMQPFRTVNFCIALNGIFPSRE